MSRKERVYSGDKSKRFWKRINALPEPYKGILYSMGCTLQDAEHRMLNELQVAENANRKKKATR